jgi:hypothetical protein
VLGHPFVDVLAPFVGRVFADTEKPVVLENGSEHSQRIERQGEVAVGGGENAIWCFVIRR